jgi:hypothetical protein
MTVGTRCLDAGEHFVGDEVPVNKHPFRRCSFASPSGAVIRQAGRRRVRPSGHHTGPWPESLFDDQAAAGVADSLLAAMDPAVMAGRDCKR